MRVLLDTNILTRSFQPHHEHHPISIRAIDSLKKRGELLFIVPQNLYEFYVVATRPLGENEFGLNPDFAIKRIHELKRSFNLNLDSDQLLFTWETMILNNEVRGKSAHDARLVASMELGRIEGILTFNGAHFKRFEKFLVIDPNSVS